jgi:hypothetical protein
VVVFLQIAGQGEFRMMRADARFRETAFESEQPHSDRK